MKQENQIREAKSLDEIKNKKRSLAMKDELIKN